MSSMSSVSLLSKTCQNPSPKIVSSPQVFSIYSKQFSCTSSSSGSGDKEGHNLQPNYDRIFPVCVCSFSFGPKTADRKRTKSGQSILSEVLPPREGCFISPCLFSLVRVNENSQFTPLSSDRKYVVVITASVV